MAWAFVSLRTEQSRNYDMCFSVSHGSDEILTGGVLLVTTFGEMQSCELLRNAPFFNPQC